MSDDILINVTLCQEIAWFNPRKLYGHNYKFIDVINSTGFRHDLFIFSRHAFQKSPLNIREMCWVLSKCIVLDGWRRWEFIFACMDETDRNILPKYVLNSPQVGLKIKQKWSHRQNILLFIRLLTFWVVGAGGWGDFLMFKMPYKSMKPLFAFEKDLAKIESSGPYQLISWLEYSLKLNNQYVWIWLRWWCQLYCYDTF